MEFLCSRKNCAPGQIPRGQEKYSSRLPFKISRQIRLVRCTNGFLCDRYALGSTLGRPFCHNVKHTPKAIQLKELRPVERGRERICAGLVKRKQLDKSTISLDIAGIAKGKARQGSCNSCGTNMASSALVPNSAEHVSGCSSDFEHFSKPFSKGSVWALRSTSKSSLANSGLANFWQKIMRDAGWSTAAIVQVTASLAESTIRQYSRYIEELSVFCSDRCASFPPRESAVIADFLLRKIEGLHRPAATLRSVMAAIGHLYVYAPDPRPDKDPMLQKLIRGIVSNKTVAPKGDVGLIPRDKLVVLIRSWGENDSMTLRLLRMKAIALCALNGLCRPSDLAPKGGQLKYLALSDVAFEDDLSRVTLTLHGIKNDYSRDGFRFDIVKCSDGKLDPVRALHQYIHRSAENRAEGCTDGVFLSLSKPYKPLHACGISRVLNEVLRMIPGVDPKVTAKSFRHTGATLAAESGINPDLIVHVGHWKTPDTFYKNYLHSKTPINFTDALMGPLSPTASSERHATVDGS